VRSLSLLLGFVVLFASVGHADEGIPTPIVQAIKSATVFVKVKVDGGLCSGSGFVVRAEAADAYVVTNHHVIEPKLVELRLVPDRRPSPRSPLPRHPIGPRPNPYGSQPGYTPRYIVRSFKNAAVTVVFYSGTKNEQSLPGEVLAADAERDLAIVKVTGVTKLPAPIDYLHEPELTETMPICIFGFPYGEVLATGKSSPAITVGKGSISSLRLDDDGKLALLQIDGSLNPGNSGGPVVDTHGRLVGVAVATIKNSSGIGLAIPAGELAAMLQGRPGQIYSRVAQGEDGTMTIHIEAGLIDPFHNIKSVAFHYLDAGRVADKPRPSQPIHALPGCHSVPLKIENQLAVGEIRLKKSVARVTMLCQAVCVGSNGKQAVSDSIVQLVTSAAEKVAKTAEGSPSSTTAREPQERDSPRDPHRSSHDPRPAAGAHKRPPADAELGELAADLESGDKGRRIHATLKLDWIIPRKPYPDVARALETVLLEDRDASMRAHSAALLKTWGTPESVPALKKALRDPMPYVRDRAREAIDAIDFAAEREPGDLAERKDTNRGKPNGKSAQRPGERQHMDDFDLLVADLKSDDLGRRMHALMQRSARSRGSRTLRWLRPWKPSSSKTAAPTCECQPQLP
jgi:hypothetical protein